MKKKQSIEKFFATNGEIIIVSGIDVSNEVKFPPRSKKQCICFVLNKEDVCIDLILYDRNRAAQFLLREGKIFRKEDLIDIGTEFSFEVVPYFLHEEIVSGIIPNLVEKFGHTYYGTVMKVGQSYVFMIYAKAGTTSFEDDIIYVYGIWEVELSSEFRNKLFPGF